MDVVVGLMLAAAIATATSHGPLLQAERNVQSVCLCVWGCACDPSQPRTAEDLSQPVGALCLEHVENSPRFLLIAPKGHFRPGVPVTCRLVFFCCVLCCPGRLPDKQEMQNKSEPRRNHLITMDPLSLCWVAAT